MNIGEQMLSKNQNPEIVTRKIVLLIGDCHSWCYIEPVHWVCAFNRTTFFLSMWLLDIQITGTDTFALTIFSWKKQKRTHARRHTYFIVFIQRMGTNYACMYVCLCLCMLFVFMYPQRNDQQAHNFHFIYPKESLRVIMC